MISSFKHKGLKRLYEKGSTRGLSAEHLEKIENILAMLDQACRPEDLDLPGFRLHPLKGELRGYWSVTVRAQWRVIFRFVDGDAVDVDLLDYH